MRDTRPKNLNLFTIRFPIPAIVSILHRITGFILFLLIPFLLWLFQYSLTADGFATVKAKMDIVPYRILVWALLVPLAFHLLAGIRHLLMDLHMVESLKAGRITAWLTLLFTVILILLAGFWLW